MVNKVKGSRSSSSQKAKVESKGKQKANSIAEFPRSESLKQKFSEALKTHTSSKKTEIQGPEEEWNDPMVLGLEKLLLKDLEFIFLGAIKKIVKLGYSEEEAQSAVFNERKSLEWDDTKSDIVESSFGLEDTEANMVESAFGFIDTETYIVESALYDLKDKNEFNTHEPPIFEDLSSVVSYSMLMTVSMLKTIKPDLSVAEAIWYMLMCDCNLCLLLSVAKFNLSFEKMILDYNNPDITETGGNPSDITRSGSASKIEMPKQKPLLFQKDKKGRRHKCVSREKVNTLISVHNSLGKELTSLLDDLKFLEDRCAKVPYDKASKTHVSQDERDVILMLLQDKVVELQMDKENWTNWAIEKVNQVSRRFRKHENELKKLKADKDEAEKVCEPKRVHMLEGLLATIKGRAEVAETLTVKLEEENRVLKKSIKDKISEAAASCEEIKQSGIREQDMLKRLQKEEKIKNSSMEDLKKLKARRERIESNLNKDKAQLKHEEGREAQILQSVERIQSERDQMIDAAKKQTVVALKKIEDYKKEVNEKIKHLQAEIHEVKMKLKAEKVRDPRGVFEETYKEMNENECVMCLNDEKSVVFLPCSHQVVCVKCNELHQKHGMKDCPACRTTITRRIPALFVH